MNGSGNGMSVSEGGSGSGVSVVGATGSAGGRMSLRRRASALSENR